MSKKLLYDTGYHDMRVGIILLYLFGCGCRTWPWIPVYTQEETQEHGFPICQVWMQSCFPEQKGFSF